LEEITGSGSTHRSRRSLERRDFLRLADGNAWGDPKNGFPGALEPKGYKIVDPGRYQDGSDDITAPAAWTGAPGRSLTWPRRRWSAAVAQGHRPVPLRAGDRVQRGASGDPGHG
jgi:hypothetical protein